MKNRQTIKHALLALLIAVTLSGCAFSSGVKVTETKNESRLHLRFANSKAASNFYQSFFENVDKTSPSKSLNAFLKFNFGTERNVSDNVKLNDAFRSADKNRSGVVSEKEAIAYVQSLSNK